MLFRSTLMELDDVFDTLTTEDGEIFLFDGLVDVNDHSHMWQLIVTTLASEMLVSGEGIINLVNLVKPAGVRIYHEAIT